MIRITQMSRTIGSIGFVGLLALAAGCQGEEAPAATEVASGELLVTPTLLPTREVTALQVPARAPRVQHLAIKPNRDGRGTTLLVQFDPDERVGSEIVLRPSEKETLRFVDTGEEGDDQKGDRIFSAVTSLDFGALSKSREILLEQLQKEQVRTAPVFDGRRVVAERFLFEEKALGGLAFPFGFPWLISEGKSLAITDLSVVEDPARTFNPCTGVGTPMGKWTFGYLMSAMAGAGNPSTFVRQWLEHWLANQVVNGFNVPGRPSMATVLASWPKNGDGTLNLARAPFKLLAIFNRIDLAGNAGYSPTGEAEGRFVFQWMDPSSCTANPFRPFLVILEYGVPRKGCFALKDWAKSWKSLTGLPMPSPAYNAALEALTEQFAAAGVAPGEPNGSAINQVRTNDFKLASPWELREFRLRRRQILLPGGGVIELPALLAQRPVVNNPDDLTWNGQHFGPRAFELGSWINANRPAIVAEAHTVPETFPFAPFGPFLAGAAINNFDHWEAPGILPWGASSTSDVRHKFSLNTCNGCHGRETSNAPVASEKFTHVRAVANWGATSTLSGFLTGIDVTDPDPATGAGVVRHFDDLAKRKVALNAFANAHCGPFFLPEPELTIDPFRFDPDPVIPFAGLEHQQTLSAH